MPGQNKRAKAADYEDILQRAGYPIIGTIKPKEPGASSGSFITYVVTDPDGAEGKVVFGARDPEAKEKIQIGEINQAISQRINIAIEGLAPGVEGIDISMGRKIAEGVVSAVKAPPGAKPDTYLVNSRGETVGQISLKATDVSSGMNQWGGVSDYVDQYPDIMKFADGVRRWMSENNHEVFPEKVVLRCRVKNPELAHSVVFGREDEVDLVIASETPIGISFNGTNYEFTADHKWENPTIPGGLWTPAFITRRAKARKELGIPGGRSFIASFAYRAPASASYKNIETLCEETSLLKELITEELTKSDKKEIDRLIRKGIEKDRSEQKKLIRKEIEAELKKSLGVSYFMQPGKIRKAIEDVCHDQVARELKKGGDIEKSVVEITKSVLQAWHDLLHKQKQLINRIKV
jgi:hypothetical protein